MAILLYLYSLQTETRQGYVAVNFYISGGGGCEDVRCEDLL